MTKYHLSHITYHISQWRWAIFSGLGIIVLFFLLRLINLTALPIFADEAIYIRWSQVMKAESTLRFLPLSDGKQPLFMWLLMPFFSFINDPLFAGRFLSVISGFGTLVGVFFLGFFLFRSKLVALLGSLIYAVIPFAVFFDRMALVDSLLTMFGVWILLLGLLLARYERLDLAIVTGLILGGALITKSPAIFFAFLLPTTILFSGIDFKKKRLVQLIKLVSLWLVVYFFAFAVYNILRLGPNFHMIALRNQDYIFSFREVFSHPLDPFRPHIGQVWEWFLSYLGWPVILAFLGGLVAGLKKYPKETLLLLAWFAFPLLVQMSVAKVFTARYVFFTIPYFLLVGAYFLDWLRKRWGLMAALITLLLVVIPGLYFNFFLLTDPQKAPLPADDRRGYLEEWTSGYGIDQVRDFLKKLPGEKQIIVGTEGYFGTLPDGLQIYFDKDPKVTIIGVGLGLNKIPEPLAESALAGNPSYLVVNKSRMGAQNDPGLSLLLEILKAKGVKGQDSLLFYQVK